MKYLLGDSHVLIPGPAARWVPRKGQHERISQKEYLQVDRPQTKQRRLDMTYQGLPGPARGPRRTRRQDGAPLHSPIKDGPSLTRMLY
jgi:hypothetical protein